jgi:hypothetical protein
MSEKIRIFSYLPNPRVWKSLITGRLGDVKVKVLGDKPKNLVNWLWDFDAEKLSNLELDESLRYDRCSLDIRQQNKQRNKHFN